ncbi:ribokinase [mine drainage metagenome]|uniref:Ribokinase n=1 Tax=mine drainage metagenome TaxID=410659 RepID=T1B8U2_9ZZZZ
MDRMGKKIVVLGSYVADVAFRAARLPAWGETLMGSGFALGPGGKGSNQAVAAARAGAAVQMISRLGDDAFGRLARETWAADGIDASLVGSCDVATGAAAILIDEARGENAIIVVPGACFTLTAADVDAAGEAIRSAGVLLTQLELPLGTVERGLRLARAAGALTILNPAPAQALGDEMLGLVDFLIPNESEAALLTGQQVESVAQAESAARALRRRGARCVIVTLGAQGALVCAEGAEALLVGAFNAGAVVETTGAGDAFCGGFAAALSEGRSALEAVRFGCATAGISVTRAGTAPSMPRREEIEALLGVG